eukprot:2443220-Alexandrium_andersonii.AAC.1
MEAQQLLRRATTLLARLLMVAPGGACRLPASWGGGMSPSATTQSSPRARAWWSTRPRLTITTSSGIPAR